MALVTVFLMAVSLAMDALAVSISNGICYGSMTRKRALWIGLYFGGFQFIMPLLGWLLGTSVRTYITAVDHWIAFALLAYIGGSMIYGALIKAKKAEPEACPVRLTHGKLILQAIATSIDALAVGISISIDSTFADISILISAGIIGIVAFVFSVFGALVGNKLGALFQKWAETIGGLVLIGIGVKILIEHLMAG